MKLRQTLHSLMLCLFVLLAPALASADIFVDRAIIRMSADQPPRQDFKVINNGDEVGYVNIEVFEVRNPGTSEEELVKVTDPKEMKLIATPSKLIVQAKSQKMVRLINTVAPGDERIYRINVTPVLPPLADPKGSMVRVVVAYQILLMIDAVEPAQNLDISRTGKTLRVVNKGNTNVLFYNGSQCPEGETNTQSEQCQQLPTRRVYPGNTWEAELPKDQPAAYQMTSFEGSTQKIIH